MTTDPQAVAIIAALTQRLAQITPNSIPLALTRAELEAAPAVRLSWNADRDRLTIHQDKPFSRREVTW